MRKKSRPAQSLVEYFLIGLLALGIAAPIIATNTEFISKKLQESSPQKNQGSASSSDHSISLKSKEEKQIQINLEVGDDALNYKLTPVASLAPVNPDVSDRTDGNGSCKFYKQLPPATTHGTTPRCYYMAMAIYYGSNYDNFIKEINQISKDEGIHVYEVLVRKYNELVAQGLIPLTQGNRFPMTPIWQPVCLNQRSPHSTFTMMVIYTTLDALDTYLNNWELYSLVGQVDTSKTAANYSVNKCPELKNIMGNNINIRKYHDGDQFLYYSPIIAINQVDFLQVMPNLCAGKRRCKL
ncbi:MAG: hypothetical protein MZU91_05735 [Desulfosudis oleivorans]|nr:hypothetical protein [Desulfosudis oleivorans]